MFSQATSDGVMALIVTFKLGTDIDKAQVLVQNRVPRRSRSFPRKSAGWASPRPSIARPDHGGSPGFARRPL